MSGTEDRPAVAGRIACFLPSLYGGGAERVAMNLVRGFAERGLPVDLVLGTRAGEFAGALPPGVRVIELSARRVLRCVVPLARYLRRERPAVLLAHMSHANIAALLARRLSGTAARVIVVEHFTMDPTKSRFRRDALLVPLARRLYRQAAAIVGVSAQAARALEQRLRLPEGTVRVIYNPVVDASLADKAAAAVDHPWLTEGAAPLFLAVGRLVPQKDYATLLRAFAEVRPSRPLQLLILGEGELRSELQSLARSLGVAEDVGLPGFVENPYAFMRRSAALVLSSQWEALPTVLIEAMACGCPVVATDCPYGPWEILEGGRYGPLVPPGDAAALAAAMRQIVEQPTDRAALLARAACFSVERAVDRYLDLIAEGADSRKEA